MKYIFPLMLVIFSCGEDPLKKWAMSKDEVFEVENKFCKERGHVFRETWEPEMEYNEPLRKVIDSTDITFEDVLESMSSSPRKCLRCNSSIIKDTSWIERHIVWSKCFRKVNKGWEELSELEQRQLKFEETYDSPRWPKKTEYFRCEGDKLNRDLEKKK